MGNRISTEDLYKITQSLADRAVSDVKKRREDERKREEAIKKNREERLAAAAEQNRIPNYKGGSLWDQYKAALASGEAKNASDFITKRDARNAAWNKVGAETLNDDMEALAKSISSTYGTQFDPSKYYSQETINGSSDQVKKMRDRLNALAEYYNTYGGSDDQKKAVGEQIKAYDSELKFLNDLGAHYGQYKNEADFNYRTDKRRDEDYIVNDYDAEAGKKNLAELKGYLDRINTSSDSLSTGQLISNARSGKKAYNRTAINEAKQQYGLDGMTDDEVLNWLTQEYQLESFALNNVDRMRTAAGYRNLANNEDFLQGVISGKAVENPTFEDYLNYENEMFRLAEKVNSGVATKEEQQQYAELSENAPTVNNRFRFLEDVQSGKYGGQGYEQNSTYSGLDKALLNSKQYHYEQMTDDEKRVYYYLLGTQGAEAADRYLDDLKTTLDYRNTEEVKQYIRDLKNSKIFGNVSAAALANTFGGLGGAALGYLIADSNEGVNKTAADIAYSAASVPLNVFGGAISTIGEIGQRLDLASKGDWEGKGYNPYANYNLFSVAGREARGLVAKDIEDKIGWEMFGQNVMSQVYQSLMSGVDSAFGMATLGKLYTISMGGSAAASKAAELYESGASSSQIYWESLFSGIAEATFEYLSIENLSSIKSIVESKPTTLKKAIKMILTQNGIEASEEIFTEISNTVIDKISKGYDSDYDRKVTEYVRDGMTREEAVKKAAGEVAADIGWAGAGGFISGLASSSLTIAGAYRAGKENADAQISAIDPGNAEGLYNNAKNIDYSILNDASEALKKGDAKAAAEIISEGKDWYEYLKSYAKEKYGKNQASEISANIDASIDNLNQIKNLISSGDINADSIQAVLEKAKSAQDTKVDVTSANDEKLFSLLAKGELSNSVIEKNILKDRGTLAAFERLTGLRIGGTTVSQKRAAVREAFKAVSSSTETLKAAQNAIESGATATEGHKNAAVIIDQAMQANRAENSRLRNSEKVKSAETKAAIDATNRQHRFLETVRNYVINGGDLSGFTESPISNVSGEGGANSSETKTTQETAKKRVRADFSAYQDEKYSAENASALANLNSKAEQDAFFRNENAGIEQEIKNIESSDSITAEEKAQRIGELKEAASRNNSLAKAMDDFREMGRLVRAGEVDKVIDSLRKPLKKMGVNIEVVDNVEAADGMKSGAYFDKRTNTIKVSRDWNGVENVVKLELAADGNGFVLNPGKSVSFDRAVTQTIAHEIAHADPGLTLDFIKAVAGTQYDAFDLKGRLEHPDDRSWRSEDAQKEKNWRRYVDAYTEQAMLEMKGTEEQRRASAEKVVNDAYIFEEIMADMFGAAVDDMGHSGKAGENIFWAMNRNKPGIIKRILNALERFIARIRGKDAYLAVEQRQAAERLRDMLTGELKRAYGTEVKGEAAVESGGGKKYRNVNRQFSEISDAQTIEDGGTIENDSGEFVAESDGNGGTRWSLSTYESSGRETLRQYLDGQVSESGLTEADAKAVLDSMDDIYEICRKYEGEYAPFGAWSRAEVVIDEKGNPVFSVVKPNGEYAMNLDFSLVCKKRRALDAVLNRLIETGAINDFGFGQEEIVRVNEIIREHGFEIACDMCFVDAKRYRQAGVADQFVDLYNSIVKSMAKDGQEIDYFNFANDSSLSHTEGGIDRLSDAELDFSEINEITKPGAKKTVEYRIAQYLKTHPSDRKLLSRGDFMSTAGFDAVKVSKPGILKLYNSKKGTGGPKAAQSDVQYLNDILSSKKFNRNAAYDVGGVRVQSFSDYVPRLVFDYVQMIGDLAAKRLPAHAYTKEPLFAKQFGLTGMKINMSLMPAKGNGKYAGLNADGSYAWARESFPAEEAFRIQADPEYGKNVGTIAVGISDEHIWKMLSDPYIRMVIPYHKSGINPIVALKLKIGEYTDYTGQQNTRRRDGKQLTKAELKNIPDINRLMHRDGLDAVEASRRYVEWCEDNGYIPKFEKFAYMTDSDGNRVFNENYYKLLEDFTTMVDGEFHPQGDVTATFPGSDSAFGSMADLIKEGLEEDAVTANRLNAEVDGLAEEVRSALGREESGKRFSLTRANDEYMKAVESGNVEEQQRLVDEAAENAGYDSPKVFHQTGERFWEFKTDNPVAGAYDSETPNGIFFKSNDHDIGVGGNYVETGRGGEIQMAAYLRMENTLHFSDRKEANAWYVKNVPGYEAAQTEMKKAVEPFDRQIDALDDEFFVNDSISEEEYDRQWNNLIEKLRETENKYRKRLREILDDYFLTGNSGYDSIELDYDGHRYIDGKRENVHTYIVFDGSQVKSADPITYDDSGNVIPLTERFDSGNRDIRWSLAGTNEDRAEAAEFSDSGIRYSLRKEDPPKKTLTGYKVFVVKNGKLYPPMVANPDAADTPVGVWLNADIGAQAPDSKTGRKQVKAGGKGTQGGSGSLAFRPGWHLGETPLATQFDRTNPETGKRELFPENFVWAECEIAADKNYQEEAMSYGYTKSGKFQHSLAGLPKIPVDGYYKYRTNPNPDTVPWLITGAMKVNRLLDDAEVNRILESKGLPPKNRVGGNKTLADLGLEETAKRLNGDENIRHSLVKSAQSELKALQKENEKLRQDVDDLKQELQLTHGRKLSRDALISSIQKILIDGYGVKLSAKELYPHVTNLYDMFYNNTVDGKRLKKDERVDTMRIIEEMDKIVDAVIENAVGVDDTYVEMKKLLPELRNTKLVVPMDARADAAQSAGFENWAEFRKANFGRVGFANEGLPVDTYYMELSERYPELFPDGITHPGEQAAHIADVVNTIRESGINEYQLYDIEDERIRTSIKNDVMDIIGNAEKLQTFADRAAQKVEDTKLAEAMHYGADIAKLKRLNAEKVAGIKAENRKRLSDMRRKYQDRVESVRERYAEARANRSEKQKQTVLRNKVLRKYTEASTMLDRPTTENHFTEAMRKPLMEFLAAVDITTGKSVAKQGIYDRILRVIEAANKATAEGGKDGLDIAETDLNVQEKQLIVDSGLLERMAAWIEANQGKKLTELSSAQLEELNGIFNQLKHLTAEIKRLYDPREGLAAKSWQAQKEIGLAQMKERKQVLGAKTEKAREKYEKIHFGALDAAGYYNTLGSDTMTAQFERFRQCQNRFSENIQMFTDRLGEIVDGAIPKDEHGKNAKEVTLKLSRGTLTATPAQLMSIHLMLNQEDSRRCLFNEAGGVIIGKFTAEKPKDGKAHIAGKRTFAQSGRLVLNEADAAKITAALTDGQRKRADAISALLNNEAARLGNEVSMAMYGYKKYTTENYFPMRTADDYRAIADNPNYEMNLLGLSFTKERTGRAGKALVAEDIYDVIGRHLTNMAQYNAFAQELDNAKKMYSLRLGDGTSLKQRIIHSYGREADAFYNKLINNLSGVQMYTNNSAEALSDKLLSNYKAAAVAGNVSVVLKQPMSIFRALPEFSLTGLKKSMAFEDILNLSPKQLKANTAEMLKYSGIARLKAWGSSENMTRKSFESLYNDNSDTARQKINEFLTSGAENADMWTWAKLWRMSKAEIDAQGKYTAGSKEYFEAVDRKFSDVIGKTQVVQSALDSSMAVQNAKGFGKFLFAFQNEPLKQYSYLISTLNDARRGKPGAKKKLAKVIASSLANTAAVSAISTFMAWLRGTLDRDDDDELLDDLMKEFAGNSIDDLLSGAFAPVWQYIDTIMGAINSGVHGNTVERLDMAALTDLGGLINKYFISQNGGRPNLGTVQDIVNVASNLFGLPAKNIFRDVKSVIDRIILELPVPSAAKYNYLKAWKDVELTNKAAVTEAYYDVLRDAVDRGRYSDYVKIKRDMIYHGYTETKIKNAVMKSSLMDDLYELKKVNPGSYKAKVNSIVSSVSAVSSLEGKEFEDFIESAMKRREREDGGSKTDDEVYDEMHRKMEKEVKEQLIYIDVSKRAEYIKKMLKTYGEYGITEADILKVLRKAGKA